jgi:hypothetical protein
MNCLRCGRLEEFLWADEKGFQMSGDNAMKRVVFRIARPVAADSHEGIAEAPRPATLYINVSVTSVPASIDKSGGRATRCRVCCGFADFRPLWVQASETPGL